MTIHMWNSWRGEAKSRRRGHAVLVIEVLSTIYVCISDLPFMIEPHQQLLQLLATQTPILLDYRIQLAFWSTSRW